MAENKCGGSDSCVCVYAKIIHKARVEKKDSWKIEWKEEELWKEKELKNMWKRVLKCCLLKKGSKTLNSALSVAQIFPLC